MRFITVAVLCLLAAVSACERDTREAAPGFTLESNTGEAIRLSDLRGQVVMLNFWASWCGPCRQEMPHLDALYQRYSTAGFTLLGVNVDVDKAAADKFLEENPVSFPIVYDSNGKVSEAYGVDAMPTTILIDQRGQVRYTHRGYKAGDEEEYQHLVQELLQE